MAKYTYGGILFSLNKENLPYEITVNLGDVILSEIR